MRSPFAVALFFNLIEELENNYGSFKVNIITKEFIDHFGQKSPYLCYHDWTKEHEVIFKNTLSNTKENCTLELKPNHELTHSRILIIKWDDDSETKLRFDQGFGYWFSLVEGFSQKNKVLKYNFMSDKSLYSLTKNEAITVKNQKDTPTFIFIKHSA